MANKASRLKTVSCITFWICFAVLIVLGFMHAIHKEPIDDTFFEQFTEFDAHERVSENPITYEVSLEGEQVGYLVFDSHYGYQSDIMVATLVGMDGSIDRVETYTQNETPSYFRKLIGGGFFKKNFVGDPAAEGFSIDTNVDAVSHATISSNAVTHAVEKGSQYVAAEFLNQETKTAHDTGIKFGMNDVALIVMFVLAFLGARFTKKTWLQWLIRIYSIVMMGFIAAQFITVSVMVAFTTFAWPDIHDYLRWYIMVFGVLALLIGTGRNTYCSHMCPFGAFQELEYSLAGTLASPNFSPRYSRYIRFIPPLLLALSVGLAFVTHDMTFTSYEPFSLLFGRVGVGIQWALLPIILVGSLFVRRFYCKAACPVGYALNKVVIARNKVVKKVWPKRKHNRKVAKQA